MHPILLGFLIIEDAFYFPHPPTHFPRAPTPLEGIKTIPGNNSRQLNCSPHTSTRGMSDVLHIKLRAGYEPTNNATAFGLLAVIPVKPRLSAVIHHDAFRWFGAFKPEQVLGFKGTVAIQRKVFFFCFFFRNEAAVVAYFRAPQIGPTSSCRCASAGLNWWCGDVRVWDSGRVLALHYSQQLGLSL